MPELKAVEGFSANGLPLGGKRQFRDPKQNVKYQLFRNPLQFALDIAWLLVTVLVFPLWNLFRSLTREPKSLKGRVALVTGAGRGLGRAICIQLAKEGAIVACTDVNEENNNATCKILTEMGAKARAYKLNVANRQEVEATIEKVESELGVIYLLVNNAGILVPSMNPSEEYVRAMFNVNTMGPIWTTEALLPKMRKRNDGHIANVSSASAFYGTPFLQIYCASKAALTSYAQAMRLQLALDKVDNVHITTLHPSFINTSADYVDMLDSRLPLVTSEGVAKYLVESIQYNRGDCTTNSIVSLLLRTATFAPIQCMVALTRTLDARITIPSQKEFSLLPSGDLVKSGNSLSEKS